MTEEAMAAPQEALAVTDKPNTSGQGRLKAAYAPGAVTPSLL